MKIKDVLEEQDFVPDENKAKKEFRSLENADQQQNVVNYRQEIGKIYGKSNRYKAELPNKLSIILCAF